MATGERTNNTFNGLVLHKTVTNWVESVWGGSPLLLHYKIEKQNNTNGVKSASVAPSIESAFASYHLFQCYPQSKEILLNLGMKCWNLAFNAQGSRVIIVV